MSREPLGGASTAVTGIEARVYPNGEGMTSRLLMCVRYRQRLTRNEEVRSRVGAAATALHVSRPGRYSITDISDRAKRHVTVDRGHLSEKTIYARRHRALRHLWCWPTRYL